LRPVAGQPLDRARGIAPPGGGRARRIGAAAGDQAAQIYQIRALLEGHAARVCAERASDEAIEHLAELNEQTQAAFRDGDLHEVIKRTGAFYEALFRVSGLTIALDIVQSLNARINRLRFLTISASGRRAEAAKEMAQIVRALRKRDADAAEQASHRHMHRVAEIATKRLSHN
jgi:DNA-binding GntR family transcriptional regulator